MRVRVTYGAAGVSIGDAMYPPREGKPFKWTDLREKKFTTAPVVAVLAEGVFITEGPATYTVEVLEGPFRKLGVA